MLLSPRESRSHKGEETLRIAHWLLNVQTALLTSPYMDKISYTMTIKLHAPITLDRELKILMRNST